MLDIMEMRGFCVKYGADEDTLFLITPDSFAYAIAAVAEPTMYHAFHTFLSLNERYP